MKQYILALFMACGLFSATACNSTAPLHQPTLSVQIADFERQPTETSGDPLVDTTATFSSMQSALPVDEKLEISWKIQPASSFNPEVKRINGTCKISIRNAYAIDEIVHDCLGISSSGELEKIFYIHFYDEFGLERKLEFTALKDDLRTGVIRGQFTQNGQYEVGYFGGRVKAGSRNGRPVTVIWSTESPAALARARRMLRLEARERRKAEEDALRSGTVPGS